MIVTNQRIVYVQAHLLAALAESARRCPDRGDAGQSGDARSLSHVVAQTLTGVETGDHGDRVHCECPMRSQQGHGVKKAILTTGADVGEQDEEVLVPLCQILSEVSIGVLYRVRK